MRIEERLARTPSLVDLAASRMAMRAKLDFIRGRTWRAFCRAAGFHIGRPFDFFATRVAPVEALIGSPRIATAVRPIEMTAARPVASLATDRYLGETRVKTVFPSIIALLDSCRVTFGAHEVPVLHGSGPMQRVRTGDGSIGIKMEPTLPPRLFGPRVPRPWEGLHSSVREGDEILLQRFDAEGPCNLETRGLAVAPFRFDDETVAVAQKPTLRSVALDGDVLEVAEHCFRRRHGHGGGVMRASPSLRLRGVTASAGRGADIARLGGADFHGME